MDERLSALIAALRDEETRSEELAGLSDEQLSGTRDELRALFTAITAGEVEDIAADDVETLTGLRDAIFALAGAIDERAEAAAEAAAEVARLSAEVEGLVEASETEPGDDDADETDAEEADDADAEPEAETVEPEAETAPAAAEEPELVHAEAAKPVRLNREQRRENARRASRVPLAELASRVPETHKPRPGEMIAQPRWQLVNGTSIDGMKELTGRFAAALESFEGQGVPAGFKQKVSVVKLRTDLSDEHYIGGNDDLASTVRKLDAVTAAARDPKSWTEEQHAIVASGGWCAPAQPRYDVPSVSGAERPFRDALPGMTVSRGSVDFVRAARLSTILANTTAAAVTTWENATDLTPGESTKTRQTAACRSIQTEALGAVVARMRFGNFQQRAFPEDVAADLELVMAQHARVAEVRLLDALIADMNIDVAQTGLVGTARDVKHHFAQAVSEIRYTERTSKQIRAAFSDVLLDMIPADLALQQASGEIDALLAGEAEARAILNSIRGFSFIATKDVPTGSDAFVTNADGENLADWPDNFEVPFWIDGTVVFADGGTLDLGIIRDSTLNGTNDYEVFQESFEGLLWLGPYGKTLTLTTCPNGESQVATDETGALCSGS